MYPNNDVSIKKKTHHIAPHAPPPLPPSVQFPTNGWPHPTPPPCLRLLLLLPLAATPNLALAARPNIPRARPRPRDPPRAAPLPALAGTTRAPQDARADARRGPPHPASAAAPPPP
ncbi:hypothetical protein DAI22_11g174550 [Oryza sativa Japonica Group]|nr:hypothetical protein DAI22_11g174550 [Oryza sativa Japonica Group]